MTVTLTRLFEDEKTSFRSTSLIKRHELRAQVLVEIQEFFDTCTRRTDNSINHNTGKRS